MIPKKYSFALIGAYRKNGKALDLAAAVEAFYARYKDLIDLQQIAPYECGMWFEAFLQGESAVLQQSTIASDVRQADAPMSHADEIETIQTLRASGLSFRQIASKVGVSEATVRRRLKLSGTSA